MRKRLSIDKIKNLPKAPGVYFLKNKYGEIFYIGKSNNIESRVTTYKNKVSPLFKFLEKIAYVEWIETANEIEALIKEAEYIKYYQPKLNARLRDDKQYFYVGITREKLPRLFITHQPFDSIRSLRVNPKLKAKSYKLKADFIGPFTDGAPLKIMMRYLRKLFPYYTANTKTPRIIHKHAALPCSWCHIGLCPGPAPDVKAYTKNIRAIKQILTGKKNVLVKRLGKEMKVAAKSQNFEDAASARDILLALENIFSHYNIVIPWSNKNHTAPELNRCCANYLRKLLKKNLPVNSIEGYDISNISGREPTGSMVRFDNSKPNKSLYRKFNIKALARPNDTLMMREVIRRRFSHREWPYPDLILIDGGRGQLNAARYELKKLGLNIPLVSLAKRLEELYLPSRKTPIPLRKMPTEVQNLLKFIRDESHRFAIDHHRRRHRKVFKLD